jgi:ATP-dependent helicase/nuclease subunit A
MRAGGVRAPSVRQAAAVQLLTVHGAKGLEAPVVLLLDTDGAAARTQTMGMLVDWPGESSAPRRFAFLASESRPPTCCRGALEAEKQARQREELNGLYVAMTRARTELVVSSVAPHVADAGSWWRRLQSVCRPIPEGEVGGAPQAVRAAADILRLDVVPPGPGARAMSDAGDVPTLHDEAEGSAQFGQALHRLLECWPHGEAACPPALRQRVAREFRLTGHALDDAAAMAARILRGEGAWAWDPDSVDWAENEVELHHAGQLLRLDRLVRQREGGVWWVLDYKSAAQPERDAALLAQMQRYRRAVAAIHPGASVQVAFLTGQGRLVVVD